MSHFQLDRAVADHCGAAWSADLEQVLAVCDDHQQEKLDHTVRCPVPGKEPHRLKLQLNGHKKVMPFCLGGCDPKLVEEALREKLGMPPRPALRLQDTLQVFTKWLYLPDDGHVKVTLGAYAGNRLAGDPVNLMEVAPPASGKTEVIVSLGDLPHVHLRSAISGEAALLSGTANRERTAGASGGLLRQIGAFGVLALKDFTTILAMKHEHRAPLLAAFREICDGHWTRDVGVDGGKSLEWRGKLGIIAGCTPTIDSHHAVLAAMGERFMFYRLPAAEPEKQAWAALSNVGQEREMRAELAAAVAAHFEGLALPEKAAPLGNSDGDRLVALATLAAVCRSAVERDTRTRVIENVPDADGPGRLTRALSQLFAGMLAVGVERQEAWRLLAKVAMDSMPALRWAVLRRVAAAGAGETVPTSEIAAATRYPAVTVRRALDDLRAHGLLDKSRVEKSNIDRWALSDWAQKKWRVLVPLFVPGPCLEKSTFPKTPPLWSTAVEKSLSGPSLESPNTVQGEFTEKSSWAVPESASVKLELNPGDDEDEQPA